MVERSYIFHWQDNDFVTKVYYDDGKLFKEYSGTGIGRKGNYIEFYENGQPKVVGQYCDFKPGIRVGEWKYYNENDKLTKTKKYRGRECRQN
jgi:antitoxin component YwqK of YwqJK toxin-antitoxin module